MKITLNANELFVGQGGVAWTPGQRTLVMQHGAGMDRTIWVLLARYFARHGFNVVAADLPGHGASKGEALTSIEAQADHLWSLIVELQQHHGLPEERIVIAGHSMGSLIALEAAGKRPDAVEQLVLLGAGYPMPVGQALLDAAAANSQAAVDMIAIFSHSYSSQLGHNSVPGISAQNSAMALLERAPPGVLHTDLQACNEYQGGEKAAKAYDGACTIIAGKQDRMTPLKASAALGQLCDARMSVIERCGHMMMNEKPEATLQAMRECLASTA